MAKKNAKTIYNIEEVNLEIDYEKLAKAIVKANQETKLAEAENEKAAREELLEERKVWLGEKDFSHIKNRLWRTIRASANRIKVFLKILFVPKEIAKSISAVDSLFKVVTSMFFGCARIALYFVTVCLTVFSFSQGSFLVLPYAVVAFLFAQLIRIAQIEVEYMEDRGYLMAIFGSVVATASIIVSVLAEFEVI